MPYTALLYGSDTVYIPFSFSFFIVFLFFLVYRFVCVDSACMYITFGAANLIHHTFKSNNALHTLIVPTSYRTAHAH